MLLLHESFESITRKIEECFEGVLRVFHRSLKSISRKSSCRGASSVFQGNFKEFGGCFKF